MTNREAAMEGYAPIRVNSDGRVETLILHHVNKEPGGPLVEVWSNTHNRRHASDRLTARGLSKTVEDPLLNWRKEHPDWDAAFNDEKAVYWKWRTTPGYVPGPISMPPAIEPKLPE